MFRNTLMTLVAALILGIGAMSCGEEGPDDGTGQSSIDDSEDGNSGERQAATSNCYSGKGAVEVIPGGQLCTPSIFPLLLCRKTGQQVSCPQIEMNCSYVKDKGLVCNPTTVTKIFEIVKDCGQCNPLKE
jgi:hypothetical protein